AEHIPLAQARSLGEIGEEFVRLGCHSEVSHNASLRCSAKRDAAGRGYFVCFAHGVAFMSAWDYVAAPCPPRFYPLRTYSASPGACHGRLPVTMIRIPVF